MSTARERLQQTIADTTEQHAWIGNKANTWIDGRVQVCGCGHAVDKFTWFPSWVEHFSAVLLDAMLTTDPACVALVDSDDLCHCESCGHLQAEPNWCHACGHRVTFAPWAVNLTGALAVAVEALREAAQHMEAMSISGNCDEFVNQRLKWWAQDARQALTRITEGADDVDS